MSDQFLFFCVNIGNENLIKEEIRAFYPNLTLSYSRKGFVTFKNKGIFYDLKTISQLEVTFATRAGICLGKARPEELLDSLAKSCEKLEIELDKCIIHSFSINTKATQQFKREVNNYSANGKTVIDVITLGEDEVWFGVHVVAKDTVRFPNSMVDIRVPVDSPSNGYLKIAQVMELFAIKVERRDCWLDFGSSPGGSSLFLLQKGCKVWGIDPAKIADIVSNNKRYRHIRCPVQDLSQELLPDGEIHWIHVDLNLNPNQAIKEVLRLSKKYNRSLKGIILTVQLTKLNYVKKIEDFEELFFDWGFSDIISRQVPSHKQEYVIIARNDYVSKVPQSA